MPKAIYIICSESGSEDRASGRASLFNLIEKIQFRKITETSGLVVVPTLSLWITAMWMREQSDVDREFEFEIVIHSPGANDPFTVGRGEFMFEKDFQRLTMRVLGQIPLVGGNGVMRVESKLRPTGDANWICQEIPILVEEVFATEQPILPS